MKTVCRVISASDHAFLVVFGSEISLEIHAKVKSFSDRIRRLRDFRLISIQPAYASVLLKFDPLETDAEKLRARLGAEISAMDLKSVATAPSPPISIPVCYEDPFAPDLASVMAHTGRSREEVIRLHSEASYHVYFLGFLPGFAYLGGLPTSLATPRLPSPRVRVPRGSVGIAGGQTGIYPLDSPGGWRLIGRTPLEVFDPGKTSSHLLTVGQDVKFEPISVEEYRRLGGSWDS